MDATITPGLGLFGSMITVRQLPEAQRSRVLDTLAGLVDDRFAGTVTRPFLTALYIGRRPGRGWAPSRIR